jgi:hypothetical protein
MVLRRHSADQLINNETILESVFPRNVVCLNVKTPTGAILIFSNFGGKRFLILTKKNAPALTALGWMGLSAASTLAYYKQF